MKQEQTLTKFKVTHILWLSTIFPFITLLFSLITNENGNYTITGNFHDVSESYIQQIKAILFRLSFIYLTFPSFIALMAIKWWFDSSKKAYHTTFMTFSGAIALGGWALFAASIDRATYNRFYAEKGIIIGILFNTITMFLMLKNLIKIRKEVPTFIGKGSLKMKLFLFLLYQIFLLAIVLEWVEIIGNVGQYLEYPLIFLTYLFYWSYVFDLKPKKQRSEEATAE